MAIRIVEYVGTGVTGRSSFGDWFDRLDAVAAAKVSVAVARLVEGNTSNVRSVGAGVFELKVDFGPGYRVYFARQGKRLILLLGGGTKRRQQADIEAAQSRWREFKRRSKEP